LLSFLFCFCYIFSGFLFLFCFLPLSSLVSVTTYFFEFVKTAKREFSGILVDFYL
jgi:hypothetical protein